MIQNHSYVKKEPVVTSFVSIVLNRWGDFGHTSCIHIGPIILVPAVTQEIIIL